MKSSLNRIIFWLIIIFIIAGSIFGLIKLIGSDGDIPLPNEVSADDWIKGNKDATITLIEYSDFQCPVCITYNFLVEDIMAEFGNHIKFVYRHFPLKAIHDNAEFAARAAEAAGLQEKFWEMHDMLFANQSSWSDLNQTDAENAFIGYANTLGLNQKQFMEDMNSKKVKNKVNAQYKSAMKAGLTGTPTFFLNGVKISNPRGLEAFRTLIRQTIEQNNK